MKPFFILIISLSFSLMAFGQADSLGFTNKAEAKNLMVNGLKEGKWVEYDIDSNRDTLSYVLVLFKTGKPLGVAKEYFINGKIKGIYPYKNGKCDGMLIRYYGNGKVWEEAPYKNGKIEGVNKVYYPSGVLEYEIPYINDTVIGGRKSYYESGKMETMDKDTIIDGENYLIRYTFYEEGNLFSKTKWNKHPNGDFSFYDEHDYDEKGHERKY